MVQTLSNGGERKRSVNINESYGIVVDNRDVEFQVCWLSGFKAS